MSNRKKDIDKAAQEFVKDFPDEELKLVLLAAFITGAEHDATRIFHRRRMYNKDHLRKAHKAGQLNQNFEDWFNLRFKKIDLSLHKNITGSN